MNTRAYHLEDAARLAMGNFIAEDAPPAAWAARATLRWALVAAAVAITLIGALAYLR